MTQFFYQLARLCALLFASATALLYPVGALAAINVTGVNSVSTGITTTKTSLVVNAVTGAARGDLLVTQVTIDSSSATITPPLASATMTSCSVGWMEISAIGQSYSGIQQRIYACIRSNTEPASYTWTFSSAVHGTAMLADFSGVDTNQPINAWAGGVGVGTSLTGPEVAAAYAGNLLVGFFGTTGAGSAIAPQASMTATTTSAVVGGVGVQAALAYEQLSTAGLTGIRSATGASGTYIGQTIALTAASTPKICFTDNFNRANLGADWATSSKGATTFIPVIATTAGNQRLQLTSNANNEATLATLQRYFPAAGNKVTVQFNHYAYGGGNTGADGVVVIFSDASVPSVAGGSGGSLGYAQYNAGAGFAGGWLGVGLDEFGNFSNPTENRYWGRNSTTANPTAGASTPNAIAIRGPSNSFFTTSPASTYSKGYAYMAGTATLAPTISAGSTSTSPGGPGYLYQITIDSRVPGQQWIRVDRDTATPTTGATYVNLVPEFDLMAKISSPTGPYPAGTAFPPIPANFWLSFTGGTGGSRNFHEIDNLQVCATKMVASTPLIHHFRFESPGTMDTCNAKAIKVTACTQPEPTCTSASVSTGDVYVTLKPSGWVGGDSVKLIGGSGILQLAQSATGTVALDIDKTKPIWPALISAAAPNATVCVSPGTSTVTSCNITVSAATSGFAITFPNTLPAACGDSGDVLIKACSGSYTGSKPLQFWYGNTDPATPADATRVVTLSTDLGATFPNSLSTTVPSSTSTPTPISVTFDATKTAKVRVKYPDVGKLTLNVRDPAATSVTGSQTFIVRPAGFAITSVTDASNVANPGAANATGTKFVAAGNPFKVTAQALTSCSAPANIAKNFGTESTLESIKLDAALVAGLGLTDNPALVTDSNFVLSNGAGTSTVNWPQVGVIKLTPRLKSASGYMGTGTDVVGTQSGNVGRFYADHLDVSGLTQGCAAGSFTYDRQSFPSTTITAKSKGGQTLTNYVGSSTPSLSFAKTVTLTDNTGKGGITAGGAATVPAVAFTALGGGSATLNNSDANHPLALFAFTNTPSDPANIGVIATDSDSGPGTPTAASATIRSGRLRISNAFGKATGALALPVQAQYWSGSSWVLNNSDSCTSLPANAFFLTGGPAATTTASAVSIAGGNGTLTLTNTGGTGSVDVAANLGASGVDQSCLAAHGGSAASLVWLRSRNGSCAATYDRDPSARATFGIYAPETRRTIHVQEEF
jgi:MSHA biogenesis protein MshQ